MDNKEAILEELVKAHGGPDQSLPPLIFELGPGWERIKKFIEWLRDLFFRGDDSTTASTNWLYLLYLGICAIAVAIGIWVFLNYLHSRYTLPRRNKSSFLPKDIKTLPEQWVLEIQDAISQHDFPRAARLRWRLFLWRLQIPDWTTPVEHLGNTSLQKIYPLMFGVSVDAAGEFQRFNEQLIELESNA